MGSRLTRNEKNLIEMAQGEEMFTITDQLRIIFLDTSNVWMYFIILHRFLASNTGD